MAHIIDDSCIACSICQMDCPEDAIYEGEDIFIIDPEKCTDCGDCVASCPTDSIHPA